jgi:hypothetical protein
MEILIQVLKIGGNGINVLIKGPDFVEFKKPVDTVYKYDTGTKSFCKLLMKDICASTDAFCLID